MKLSYSDSTKLDLKPEYGAKVGTETYISRDSDRDMDLGRSGKGRLGKGSDASETHEQPGDDNQKMTRMCRSLAAAHVGAD